MLSYIISCTLNSNELRITPLWVYLEKKSKDELFGDKKKWKWVRVQKTHTYTLNYNFITNFYWYVK